MTTPLPAAAAAMTKDEAAARIENLVDPWRGDLVLTPDDLNALDLAIVTLRALTAPAGVPDEAMVERAVDAYIKTGSSMAAALIEAFASVEQVDAAREAFRQVYDVEIHGDGSRSDNRDAAMRAALLAAQGETK